MRAIHLAHASCAKWAEYFVRSEFCARLEFHRLGIIQGGLEMAYGAFSVHAGLPSASGRADVDLEAGCSRHQNEVLAHRRLDRGGGGWFLHGGILAGPSP